MSFDFDSSISRVGTHSAKYDRRQARFGRPDVLPLWVADMDFATPSCITQALAKRLEHPIFGYTVVDPEVYQAIMDWQWQRHGWRVEREWILMLPGVMPGMDLCVQAFSQPGEAVVVQPPVYNPFYESVLRNQRQLIRNPLLWSDCRYQMDMAHLAAHLTPVTRLLHLCNPHNPGGRVWQQQELEALGELCLRHGLILVNDEIHADLVFSGHKHLPLASLDPELARRSITLNSPGKTFNIPGLHVAYAIIPDPQLRARFQERMARQHLEDSNIMGQVALKAAYQQGEPWLMALLHYLRDNLQLASREIRSHVPAVACTMPEATYLLWLDLRNWCADRGLDDRGLQQHLVDGGLGLSPGVQFGPEGSGFMRMNVALPRAQLATALERLAQVMA